MPVDRPKIYDVTPLVSSRIGVFPGDVPFVREISLDFDKGHHLRLSAISTTLHLGAHADGPNHYSANGLSIAQRDLSFYMGKCLVVRATGFSRGDRIDERHIDWEMVAPQGKILAPRLLLQTGSFPDPDCWNSDFCSYAPSLIEKLAINGVRLIGIDTPSIDPQDSKALESHQIVARHDLAVLEGLVLDHVPGGLYTLVALPLKLENADAAPVRAVLIEGEDRLGDV